MRDDARPQQETFSTFKDYFSLISILALHGSAIRSRRILGTHKWIFLKAVYVLNDQWR